ncbi:efflux RND transporter permease subunit [Desulfobacula toluolica]|uniref:MtdC2: multidrug resistande protein, AcrB/AcrD/AcrF family n=1 Tax=Desulfobacula toluolica (strain DSM 7467 / Tol2) TaxID=651182 RepID=K0NNK8_DESTT|nr:efflux RND transporter permease subunit [Desulfobacula toluolica]CCK82250.1 MtdC2: multidrug resistande protein, AcrB/AcrD/AcrF family [Desulfobacula toluolica Tol2]
MPEQNDSILTGSILTRIVRLFLTSQLSIMLIIISLVLGAFSIYITPKEEEPQIVVPMADIYVQAPGASPAEIEKLVATPLEKLLWEIDGVEYVYSMSTREKAVVTVRFFVGEDRENSIVKLHNKIQMNLDRVPPIVTNWLIKPIEIDDVPILNLTLYSDKYSDHELERVGEEIVARLSRLENISRSSIYGGRKREIRVELDPLRMKGFNVSIHDIEKALQGADVSTQAGYFNKNNTQITITSSSFLTSIDQVKALVISGREAKPVLLEDVATIIDGPKEAEAYTRIGYSNFYKKSRNIESDVPLSFPCVTLAFSKKKGTNAVKVAQHLIEEVEKLKTTIIPDGMYIEVTRNYGKTAQAKVNELLKSLGFAIVSVVILLAFALGWREACVVAIAVPISFSLALFMNYLFGYTINRVTLFALILSLGLVVDDPITNVDNIQRHIKQKILEPFEATLAAVQEVLPPVIMSTIAIIVCFTPLAFITGMMGPYMAPMAINVPLTVTFSTVCALTIVPWISYHLLKSVKEKPAHKKASEPYPARLYKAILAPFLNKPYLRIMLFMGIIILLTGSCMLAVFRFVPLKLLPFDNKNEFQIVIDMPEGTSLEYTDRVVREFEQYLATVNEVTNFVSFTGISSPMDFNGMVRHYFIRTGSHLADIRINLAHKSKRQQQSHTILLRIRKDLEKIAQDNNARVQLVEVPPGPPVLSTLVAEIYGGYDKTYEQLLESAEQIKAVMEKESNVSDIKIMTEKNSQRKDIVIDREKAALHGIDTRTILDALKSAVGGITPASLHLDPERNPLWIRVVLPRDKRSDMISISQIPIRSALGKMIPLAELVHVVETNNKKPIYHKNLEPVVYVVGEMTGRAPGEAVLDMMKTLKQNPPQNGIRVNWAGEGEWKITLRVFRDMGLAFAAALFGIYFILVINTGSYFMPMLIMMAIPLTILGIMPGFFILNLFTQSAGGFSDPVFFTATSMIGMIALGGIVIRNSLVLIEFIQDALKQGESFQNAILKSGIVRMRPIILTALTTAIGAFPITFDPVFSGLAWALIFGLFASTLFTLLVIPVTYYAVYKKEHEPERNES